MNSSNRSLRVCDFPDLRHIVGLESDGPSLKLERWNEYVRVLFGGYRRLPLNRTSGSVLAERTTVKLPMVDFVTGQREF